MMRNGKLTNIAPSRVLGFGDSACSLEALNTPHTLPLSDNLKYFTICLQSTHLVLQKQGIH